MYKRAFISRNLFLLILCFVSITVYSIRAYEPLSYAEEKIPSLENEQLFINANTYMNNSIINHAAANTNINLGEVKEITERIEPINNSERVDIPKDLSMYWIKNYIKEWLWKWTPEEILIKNITTATGLNSLTEEQLKKINEVSGEIKEQLKEQLNWKEFEESVKTIESAKDLTKNISSFTNN